VIFILSAIVVATLHVMAALHEKKHGDPLVAASGDWVKVCETTDMQEGYAKIAQLTAKERVAIFLHEGKLSAISNACAHQNGPLGEGKIIRCLVTCPWHGFQYDVTNGSSPAPFTEKVPTYNLKVEGNTILVDRHANEPGTYVEPVPLNIKGAAA
jgi:nitrite reductase/ring-hydroxylating ferredoxin subunit